MIVRDYTMADLPEVHAINEAEVPAVGSESVGDLAHIGDESAIALVAVDDVTGEIGGFCMVLAPGADYDSGNFGWFAERYDSFCYLDRIVVHEDFRRRGLAGRVYDEVEARVGRTAPLLALDVNSDPPNVGSLAFHAARGFEQVGEREFRDHRVALLVKRLR